MRDGRLKRLRRDCRLVLCQGLEWGWHWLCQCCLQCVMADSFWKCRYSANPQFESCHCARRGKPTRRRVPREDQEFDEPFPTSSEMPISIIAREAQMSIPVETYGQSECHPCRCRQGRFCQGQKAGTVRRVGGQSRAWYKSGNTLPRRRPRGELLAGRWRILDRADGRRAICWKRCAEEIRFP